MAKQFHCDHCEKTFSDKKGLKRHNRAVHENRQYPCDQCSAVFNRVNNLAAHRRQHKKPEDQETVEGKCNWCGNQKPLLPGKPFCAGCGDQGRECNACHRPMPERFFGEQINTCNSCTKKSKWVGRGETKDALNKTVVSHMLQVDRQTDLLQTLSSKEAEVTGILENELKSKKGVKWYLNVKVRFTKENQSGEQVSSEPIFRTKTEALLNMAGIEEAIAAAYQDLYGKFQEFQREGSGWNIDQIVEISVHTVDYQPLMGSSYVPLPKYIQDKKAVLNIQNSDQKCFLWSILAALHPVECSPQRVSHYIPYEKEMVVTGIDFPTPLSQIPKFERENEISINVFGYEKEIFPLYITKERWNQHVNLLLINQGGQRHFCLIRNLNRLLGDRTKYKGQMFYCNYCLHGFITQSGLVKHLPHCSPHGPQKIRLPETEEEKKIQFKNTFKQLQVPFVVYADFESYTTKLDHEEGDVSQSYTTKYQHHKPSGFCYKVVSEVGQYCKPPVVYRGEHVVETFLEKLIEEEREVVNILKDVKPMSLSAAEELDFQNSTNCHICQEILGADRVRDHNHLTGEYRGAAHNGCNLNYKFHKENEKKKNSFYLPVIIHNLRGYDAHLIMEDIGKFKKANLKCIPNNTERYISFSMGNIRFIDSMQFMNASLEKLVENLAKEGPAKFTHLKDHFPHQNELLLRKGVYPYDYVDGPEKMQQTALPLREAFYSVLKDEHVTAEDYDHAKTVWGAFGCQTLGDYHDIYLLSDVLLLADVFENFRNVCMTHYKLDPAHYYTSPGVAWDAMLKMTKVQLELIDDIDMYLMIESGIRGGISMISNKYAKANNPYLQDYDASQPNEYITYLDANNLYGDAMSRALPTGDFCWMTEDQLTTFDVMNISDESPTGYILEVDLEYPKHLHNLHSDYPLAPENMAVTEDLLSPHTLKLKKKLDLKGPSSKKLVPNLFDKKKYVVHYQNLKQYIQLGMRMTKIHRAVEFSQSPWLKGYIDFNTQMRKAAKNEFEKDFFKLMNNAVFGKTMENLRKRVTLELVHTARRMRKLCAKPNFEAVTIFNEDLAAVHLKKVQLFLNRPIYVGFCILDLSKTVMYDFHYNYIKVKYGDKAKLLMTDTDSLCYKIQTEDLYKDMLRDSHYFDTSNYAPGHYLHSKVNMKVLGKMKDECGGVPPEEYVGLRPKMYSMLVDGTEKKTAKGVSRHVTKKQLRHSQYRDCLFTSEITFAEMKQIRSLQHQVYSIALNKVGLSPYDDKRFVLENGCDTLAHGHWRIYYK